VDSYAGADLDETHEGRLGTGKAEENA